MSLSAIEGVQPGRPASLYGSYPAGDYYSAMQPPSAPAPDTALLQLASVMLTMLATAAQGLAGDGGSSSGGAGGQPQGDPWGSSGGSGVGGPQGPGGTQAGGSADPVSSLMQALSGLLEALAPLLGAMGQGMQAGDDAGRVADRLGGGGGAGGGSGAGSGAGSGEGSCAGGGSASGRGGAEGPGEGPRSHAGGPGPQGKGGAEHGGGGATRGPGSTPATPSGAQPGEIPPATGTVQVNEPIVVKAGETFDGGGKLYQAGAGLGDGGQAEGQKPVFILEDGAKLQNVQIAGADGVHTQGDATLQDVWWKDVGEDALTMKGEGNVHVMGGGAYNASDKIFQVNAGGSLTIEGFTADTFGKAVRTNGGKDFPIDITIRNSVFRNGEEAVVRSDATQASIALEGVEAAGLENDVLAPAAAQVSGAQSLGSKAHTG